MRDHFHASVDMVEVFEIAAISVNIMLHLLEQLSNFSMESIMATDISGTNTNKTCKSLFFSNIDSQSKVILHQFPLGTVLCKTF